MNIPSKLISNAVEALTSFPGIGKRTALRMALHLLNEPEDKTDFIARAIQKMKQDIVFCKTCFNVCESEECDICLNQARNHSVICVVEGIRDVIAIESTQQFNGVYHVLGGVISPIHGIGPESLNIDALKTRIKELQEVELIMALNATMEGDTTIFYLSQQFSSKAVKISTIARGISFGGELEFTDEITLAKSLASRLPYDRYIAT